MSKVCENFESKLIEYAAVLRDREQAEALYRASGYGAQEERRLNEVCRRLDKLRGPMHTALDRLALNIV
jgi:hypothetical protein